MLDDNLLKVGEKIREVRKSKGIAQDALAVIARLGRTYMGMVERGEKNISIHNLIKIAFALNVNVGELIPPISDLQQPIIKRT